MEKESKKKSGIVTVLIVIILVAAAGLGGYLLGTRQIEKETPSSKTTKNDKNNKEKVTQLEITDEVKTRLETFVTVAVAYRSTGMTRDKFIKGTDSIDTQTKLEMTNAAIYYNDKVTKNTIILGEEYQNISGVKPDQNEMVDTIKISDFDNTYKELFNEDPNYNIENLSLIGCPAPVAWNREMGKLYLLDRCGGTTVITYENKITSYDSDTKYYYIHQDLHEKNMVSNEENSTKLLWKFDKDLSFISNTVE